MFMNILPVFQIMLMVQKNLLYLSIECSTIVISRICGVSVIREFVIKLVTLD